jgi:hypothetical protein
MRLQTASQEEAERIDDLPPVNVIERELGADPPLKGESEEIRPWPDDDVREIPGQQ